MGISKAVKPSAPCKNCEDRFTGCHCTCPLYQKYKEQMQEYNDIVKGYGNVANQFIIEQCVKNKNKKAKRRI